MHITKWQDGMMHVVPWRKVFFSASAWKAFVIYPIVHAVAADAMSDRYSVEPVFYVCIEYGIRGNESQRLFSFYLIVVWCAYCLRSGRKPHSMM